MSEYDLTIGKTYGKRRNGVCLAHLHGLGLVTKSVFGGYKGDNAMWSTEDRQLTSISILNLATVGAFTDFVSTLLGQASDKLMKHETFGNLPWWMDSIWVPVDFSRHRTFEEDSDGPFFLGSVPRLLAALAEVKKKSMVPLDNVPEPYDLMRRDPEAFSRSFEGLNDNDECIQWVWRGLYDAATIAEKERLSILGSG